MKFCIYINVLIFLVLVTGCLNQGDKFQEGTIINLAKQRSQSVVKGDTSALLQILDKGFIYVNIFGETLDCDRYVKELVSFKKDSSYWISQGIDSIKVKFLNDGEVAIITFTVHDQLMYEGELLSNHCRSTFVYEKKEQDWKCVQGHTTKIQ